MSLLEGRGRESYVSPMRCARPRTARISGETNAMNRPSRILAALSLALLTACGDDGDTLDPADLPPVRAVNATRETLDVLFDGTLLKSGVAVGEVVPAPSGATSGPHVVRFRRPGIDSADVTITVAAGVVASAIARSTIEGTLFAFELSDTGSAPVDGRSKLKVVHLAESAPALDVWRTQPDFQQPTRVMFPFPLGAQSNYIESEPGAWEVWATAEGETTPALASTGSFTILGGQVWTVFLLDEAGTEFTAVPLQDR
jgi:hypothetical protein